VKVRNKDDEFARILMVMTLKNKEVLSRIFREWKGSNDSPSPTLGESAPPPKKKQRIKSFEEDWK